MMVNEMEKTQIVYMISSLRGCGPVNVLYNIVKYLDKDKYKVTILSFKDGGEKDKTKEFRKLGSHCICLNKSGKEMLLHGRKYIRDILNNIHPDVVHAQCFRSTVFMSCLPGNYRQMATMHCVPQEDFVSTYGTVQGMLMVKLYLHALGKFDRVIACSQAVADKMEKYHVVTDVVTNGIDMLPRQMSKEVARKKLNLPLDETILLSVGVLKKRKNPNLILINFLGLKNRKKLRLIFLGDGPECREFRAQNDSAKTGVYFMGNILNVDEYLAAADLYISASRSEGMPLSVLEAMRAGVPLLLSDIAPHREIIEKDPFIGQVFKVNDSMNYVRQLQKMIIQLANYKQSHIQKVYQEYYFAGTMSAKYQQIYVLKGKMMN